MSHLRRGGSFGHTLREEGQEVGRHGDIKQNQMFTLRKKPEMRARFIFVQLSWQPKAGGETGSSILCITSSSSALITIANRKEA